MVSDPYFYRPLFLSKYLSINHFSIPYKANDLNERRGNQQFKKTTEAIPCRFDFLVGRLIYFSVTEMFVYQSHKISTIRDFQQKISQSDMPFHNR